MKKMIVATLATALMCSSIGAASAQMTGPSGQDSMKSTDMNANAKMMKKHHRMKKHPMTKKHSMMMNKDGMGKM